MCVVLTLPGGREGEGRPAGCAGSPQGPCFVHTQLEKKAASCWHKRSQEHNTDVRD